jgi:hypothetical protein
MGWTGLGGNIAPAQHIAQHTIVSNSGTSNQGAQNGFFLSFSSRLFGLMQGVRHDGWIGACEQGEKTCGCANILVDLCNSRGKPLAFTRGREERGLILAALPVARHENGHEEKAIFVLPLAVSYHLCIISPTAAGQGERVYFQLLCALYCCCYSPAEVY